MYCKICGDKIEESISICPTCGTKISTGVSEQSEIVFNKTTDDNGFSSKPKEKNGDTEFYWNVHDFARPPRKEEPLEFVWDEKSEKFDLPKSESFQEKALESEKEIDKFFTFNKKSEDFQKLLDKEFERLSINNVTVQKITPKEEDANDFGAEPIIINRTSSIDENISKRVGIIEEPTYKTEDLASRVDMAFSAHSEDEANNFKKSSSYKQSQSIKDNQAGNTTSYSEAQPKKKNIFLVFFMIIITTIVLLEAAILGIKYFLPDSEATLTIVEYQKNISESIGKMFDGKNEDDNINVPIENPATTDGGVTNPDGTNGDGTGTAPITPDPMPMADKNALVASQISNNVNIKEVKYNETFKFSPSVTYKDPAIGASLPISNNVWYMDKNDKPVYYEQSAVASIIKFDSLWIDYVNTGNEAAIGLTKEDTLARENVLGFERSDGVTEEFLLLEIGEIRQTTNYLFVWTHERIKVTEDNKSVTKDYKWVYQLEPVDNELKIVNYFRY